MNPSQKPAIDVDELVEYLAASVEAEAPAEHHTEPPNAEQPEHARPVND